VPISKLWLIRVLLKSQADVLMNLSSRRLEWKILADNRMTAGMRAVRMSIQGNNGLGDKLSDLWTLEDNNDQPNSQNRPQWLGDSNHHLDK
jgi:hypothetical protein